MDSRPKSGLQSPLPLKVRSGRSIFRPHVRAIIEWDRPGLCKRPDPVGVDMEKPQINNDVLAGANEEALDTLSDEELVTAHLQSWK